MKIILIKYKKIEKETLIFLEYFIFQNESLKLMIQQTCVKVAHVQWVVYLTNCT